MPKKMTKNRKMPLSVKLFGAIALIVVVFFIAIIYISYKSIDTIYLLNAGVIAWQSETEVEALYLSPTDHFLDDLDKIELGNEISIEIFTKTGKLVYSTSYKGEALNPPYTDNMAIPDSHIKKYTTTDKDTYSIASGYYFETQWDQESQHDYLVFIKELQNGHTIKIYKQKTAFDRSAKLAYTFISTLCSIALFMILLFTLFFVKRFTKPLKKIGEVTKKISRLDFSEECPDNNVREISNLSKSINGMSHSLESALLDIRQKNEKLQKDIEQERTLEQLRDIFVSGASHELKTPISIIQGYAEGLKLYANEGNEMEKKYCDIIIEETNRMNKLVMRMLDIIRFSSGEYNLSHDTFSPYDLVQEWFNRNSKNIQDRGITVINEINKAYSATGDAIILSSVVNNYLSNALSHIAGEMILKAYGEELEDKYRIYIYNSGKIIEEKDIDKIWDSFYRADKAYSRSQGRYGLGLAIVAAIQRLHQQEYGVFNEKDGVTFWFDVEKLTVDS